MHFQITIPIYDLEIPGEKELEISSKKIKTHKCKTEITHGRSGYDPHLNTLIRLHFNIHRNFSKF